MSILLLHFIRFHSISLKNIQSEKKKSHVTAFTKVLLFFRLVEMLRNDREEEHFENFRLPF